jgi:Protein of unknown function (DUF2505)
MDHLLRLTRDPASILAEVTSEDFLTDFSNEVGVTLSDLSVSESGDQSLASMRWRFSTAVAGVPELARHFLPSEVELTWNQSWLPLDGKDRAQGNLKVRLERRPSATATGACSLVPDGGGSTMKVRTKTDAQLPFPIAGRVETLIDRDLIGWIFEVQTRVLERRGAGGETA